MGMVFEGVPRHLADSGQHEMMRPENLIGIDIIAEYNCLALYHRNPPLGSVMQPLMAEAATTAGLAR